MVGTSLLVGPLVLLVINWPFVRRKFPLLVRLALLERLDQYAVADTIKRILSAGGVSGQKKTARGRAVPSPLLHSQGLSRQHCEDSDHN